MSETLQIPMQICVPQRYAREGTEIIQSMICNLYEAHKPGWEPMFEVGRHKTGDVVLVILPDTDFSSLSE